MAKLCLVFLPILVAVLIGISRVDGNWPEWSSEYLSLLSLTSIFFPYPFDDNGSKHYLYRDVTAFLNRDLQEYEFYFTKRKRLWILTGWAPHAYFRMLAEKSGLATTMTHRAVLEGCWTKTSSLVPPTCRTIVIEKALFWILNIPCKSYYLWSDLAYLSWLPWF